MGINYFTILEASVLLGVSRKSVQSFIVGGKLGHCVVHNKVRVSEKNINDFKLKIGSK